MLKLNTYEKRLKVKGVCVCVCVCVALLCSLGCRWPACREIPPWGLGSTSEGWLALHFRSGWKAFHIILMSFGSCHVVNSVLHHMGEKCFTPTRRVLFYFCLISPCDKMSYMCGQCWTSYGWKIFDIWMDSVCCHSDRQCLQHMDGQCLLS